jgi:hypothetical protein
VNDLSEPPGGTVSPLLLAPLLVLALALLLVLVRRRRAAETMPPIIDDIEEGEQPVTPRPWVAAPAELPGAAVAPEPVVEVIDVVDAVDDAEVARHYTDLSRTLAEAGRLPEAALAQWAADLRLLAPLLGDRAHELSDALGGLGPADVDLTDPAGVVTSARAVAAGLLAPASVPADLLPDVSHLVASPGARWTAYDAGDVPAEVLPDRVVSALEAALLTSAERAGDSAGLSVGLRCDLVAHVGPGRATAESAPLLRGILEPHERAAYDARLAG